LISVLCSTSWPFHVSRKCCKGIATVCHCPFLQKNVHLAAADTWFEPSATFQMNMNEMVSSCASMPHMHLHKVWVKSAAAVTEHTTEARNNSEECELVRQEAHSARQ